MESIAAPVVAGSSTIAVPSPAPALGRGSCTDAVRVGLVRVDGAAILGW